MFTIVPDTSDFEYLAGLLELLFHLVDDNLASLVLAYEVSDLVQLRVLWRDVGTPVVDGKHLAVGFLLVVVDLTDLARQIH